MPRSVGGVLHYVSESGGLARIRLDRLGEEPRILPDLDWSKASTTVLGIVVDGDIITGLLMNEEEAALEMLEGSLPIERVESRCKVLSSTQIGEIASIEDVNGILCVVNWMQSAHRALILHMDTSNYWLSEPIPLGFLLRPIEGIRSKRRLFRFRPTCCRDGKRKRLSATMPATHLSADAASDARKLSKQGLATVPGTFSSLTRHKKQIHSH